MYFYSDITFASMTAGLIIARIESIVFELSKNSADNVEFMHSLAITDDLNRYWNSGRYVSFLHTLYDLNDLCKDYADKEDVEELAVFLESAIKEMNRYETVLFDYMASRGDASFNETANLHKWAIVKTKIELGHYNNPWCTFKLKIDDDSSNLDGNKELLLLSEMVYAIKLADTLLEFDSDSNCSEFEELRNDLKAVGAFDRWRKF